LLYLVDGTMKIERPIPPTEGSSSYLSSKANIGHLAYGAAVGITVYYLEARYRPWWVSRTAADAERIAHHKEQIMTSAPALCVLVVVIVVSLPITLGM
jgi:hypothetical protein